MTLVEAVVWQLTPLTSKELETTRPRTEPSPRHPCLAPFLERQIEPPAYVSAIANWLTHLEFDFAQKPTLPSIPASRVFGNWNCKIALPDVYRLCGQSAAG